MDWDRLSRDVGLIIVDNIIDWSGQTALNQKKREERRKLRDSTLFNLSLVTKISSSFWLSRFLVNITIPLSQVDPLLRQMLHSSMPFQNTRSLRVNKDKTKAGRLEWIDSLLKPINHPDLTPLKKKTMDLIRIKVEQKEVQPFLSTLNASSLALVVDFMPRLERLRIHGSALFHLVKLEKKGTLSYSRPLMGFSNLKVLHLEDCEDDRPSVRNGIFLLIFLERLLEAKMDLDFGYKDDKFLQDHKEVLTGRSKVTRLDLSYHLIPDKRKKWPNSGSPFQITKEASSKETDLLKLVLGVTKDLVEFKFQNHPRDKVLQSGVSLRVIMEKLHDSANSLKFLSLIGLFEHLPIDFNPEEANDDSVNTVLEFKHLETLSVDEQSILAFRQFNTSNKKVRLALPSLINLHFFGGGKGGPLQRFPEADIIQWIKMSSFPSSIRNIICSKRCIWIDGQDVALIGPDWNVVDEWKILRKTLRELCVKKGFTLTLLEDDDQVTFGTILSLRIWD